MHCAQAAINVAMEGGLEGELVDVPLLLPLSPPLTSILISIRIVIIRPHHYCHHVLFISDEESAIFGHLHFVFRDWQYENSDEKSVFKDIFKEERSTETAAAVRNQIRRSIKDSFKSINIWLFPPPVSDASQLRTKLTFEIVEAPFREKLRAFRNTLSLQLREPMKFGGRPMNGRKMGALVETVAAVLNSGETVCPEPGMMCVRVWWSRCLILV